MSGKADVQVPYVRVAFVRVDICPSHQYQGATTTLFGNDPSGRHLTMSGASPLITSPNPANGIHTRTIVTRAHGPHGYLSLPEYRLVHQLTYIRTT